jgi:hypothetical protein
MKYCVIAAARALSPMNCSHEMLPIVSWKKEVGGG